MAESPKMTGKEYQQRQGKCREGSWKLESTLPHPLEPEKPKCREGGGA